MSKEKLMSNRELLTTKRRKHKKKSMREKLPGITFSQWVISCLLLTTSMAPLLQAHVIQDVSYTVESGYFFPLVNSEIIEKDSKYPPSINPIQRFDKEEWNRTIGGSNIDVGYCVRQTTDGGYIISGYTRSYGASGHNMWLIKMDSSGNELWNKTFGGSNDDEAESVQQTTDGGYILAGWTKSYGAGMKDLWLVKTDPLGNEQWNKVFGGTQDDGGTSVRQTTDGGYIVAGYTSSSGAGSVDAWLIKTDNLGNPTWTKTHGGSSTDGAYCVEQTTDDGYILTGWTMAYGPGPLFNVWLVKTDSVGNQQWNKVFGGADADQGRGVSQTADGGYIITGYTDSYGAGLYDMLLIKTDASGNEQWTKTFGGTGRDYGYSVQQTYSGGYIVAGYTLSYGAGGDDVWVVKTDSIGTKQWDETFGGTSSDVGYSVQQTTDGGYIVTGHTLSYGAGVHDVWLIKVESDETPPPPLEVDAGGPYEGIVGELIQFTGIVEGGVPPYVFEWDFGDTTTSTEQSPSHAYLNAGIYEANFTVVDTLNTIAQDTATVTIRTSDTTPPNVAITKPLANSLYLRNKRVLPFPTTLLIGAIDVTVNASDTDSNISSVTFSLNGVLRKTATEPPYEWEWTERVFGRFTIEVAAYDEVGNNATDDIIVWKLF